MQSWSGSATRSVITTLFYMILAEMEKKIKSEEDVVHESSWFVDKNIWRVNIGPMETFKIYLYIFYADPATPINIYKL